MNERRLQGVRIGCAMTGSFCTFQKVFNAWRALRSAGAELYPIMSFNASRLDTRFGDARDVRNIFTEITGREIWDTLEQVEPIGPKKLLDLLIVAPCTGSTLARIANGFSDTPAALAVKSHLRNGRPVLIAVSTNDGLAASAKNLGEILCRRGIFFVPFRQDDWEKKPASLVADFDLMVDSAACALENRQIQPILRASLPEKGRFLTENPAKC